MTEKPIHEPFECSECEGELILDGDDKRCSDCGLINGYTTVSRTESQNPWEEWWDYRRNDDDISGWFGKDRITMVGGFLSPWFSDEGELAI